MKKKKTKSAKSASKFPRRPVMIITAVAVVAIAAITVVSRQSAGGEQANGSPKVATPMANAADQKYTKVKIAGQDVFVDSQTGKIKPLTAQEAQQLAQGLKGMLNKSTEGLREEQHADGSVSMDLQGRFQNVTVARENEDGTTTQACIDNPKAAAAFFGIDQKLLEPEKTPPTKAAPLTPATPVQ